MTEPKVSKTDPLNLTELAQIAISLQALVGAQLQECVQSSNEAGLGFYHDRSMVWLWFDLNPQRPMVLRFDEQPPSRKKVARPLTLFIKSHFNGRRLAAVKADVARGRILVFSFYRSKEEQTDARLDIEAHLIPHAANLIAVDGRSVVAESKPKTLPAQNLAATGDAPVVREWSEIKNQWLAMQSAQGAREAGQPANDALQREKKFQKAVEKKRTALVRMAEELAQKTSSVYRDVGEWLKANASLDVPAEWRGQIDSEKSLSWNIENLFHRAKENERKAEGTRARIALVQKELAQLEAQGPEAYGAPTKGQSKSQESLLARADAKGRRHQIAPDLDVYIGKSAADNLSILRKAQPFDLWLHLRDHPGAHAILRRTRGRIVTDQELQEAGRWVFEQSLGLRAKNMKGERFDLLIVDCRYVRPIKGDKLGRVNYSNDRVMTIRY